MFSFVFVLFLFYFVYKNYDVFSARKIPNVSKTLKNSQKKEKTEIYHNFTHGLFSTFPVLLFIFLFLFLSLAFCILNLTTITENTREKHRKKEKLNKKHNKSYFRRKINYQQNCAYIQLFLDALSLSLS